MRSAPNPLQLPGERVCLVTGATAAAGIGRAVALALGEHGATVVGTSTTQGGAARIGQYLQAAGIRGGGRVLDATSGASVRHLIDEVSESFGAPAVLVNNAGITRDHLLMRMQEADWDAVADTNLKSAYRLCKACLRGMTRARYGRIINITSVVAATGNPGQANYAAAKAGLIGFSKSLACEVASRNITVNSVAPGFIDTDMTGALSGPQRDALLQRIPLARFGTAEEVAAAVLFLASTMGDYITGSTLHVNGGLFMA